MSDDLKEYFGLQNRIAELEAEVAELKSQLRRARHEKDWSTEQRQAHYLISLRLDGILNISFKEIHRLTGVKITTISSMSQRLRQRQVQPSFVPT